VAASQRKQYTKKTDEQKKIGWNPEGNLKFESERTQPAIELISRIERKIHIESSISAAALPLSPPF